MTDPTGTVALRRSFLAEANRRLSQLRSKTHEILVGRDLMSAKNDPMAELLGQPGHRLPAFTNWFERAANEQLGGAWPAKYLQRAYGGGAAAAGGLTGMEPSGQASVPIVYHELAQREFGGIAAAMVQQISRATASAAIGGMKPALMYRAVLAVMRKVGQARLKTAVDTLVVWLHNAGRLEHFRAVGVTQVGVDAEMLELPRPSRFGQRLRHDHQHDHFQDDAASDLAEAEDAFAEAQQRLDEARANVAQAELAESQMLSRVEITAARVDTEMREVTQVESEVAAAEARADAIRNNPGSSAAQIAYGELMVQRAEAKLARAQARLDAAIADADAANTASEAATADADAARAELAAADSALQEAQAALQAAQLAVQVGPQVAVETAGDDRVCFPAFTMVCTSVGNKPIQYIRIGDHVLTRAGFKKVVQIGQRRYAGRLLLISTVMMDLERVAMSMPAFPMQATQSVGFMGAVAVWDRARQSLSWSSLGAAVFSKTRIVHYAQTFGAIWFGAIRNRALSWWHGHNVPSLPCTSDHPIWCERKGFVPAHELVAGDILQLVGDQRVKVSCISDLGFGDMDNRPVSRLQRLIAALVWFAMPVRAIHFDSDAVKSKIYDVVANLKFSNERKSKPFQRMADGSLDRCFAGKFAIAGTGAKSCNQYPCGLNAKFFGALQAGCMDGRAAAFFRAVRIHNSSSQIAVRLNDLLAATKAVFLVMTQVLLFAVPRTEVVSMRNCSVDRELFFATNTNLADFVGAAGVVASTGAKSWSAAVRSVWRNMIERCITAMASAIAWCSPTLLSRHAMANSKLLGLSPIVYNLTVEDQPEYFANGILVHNCQICQDFADAGPYSLDEAQGMLPLHPRCRCAWVPA